MNDDGSPGARPPVDGLSYTDATKELDSIVEFFERRDVDVDQLVARLERAVAIVDELDRRLHRTRTQVELLVPRLEAVARSEPGLRTNERTSSVDDGDGEWETSDVSDDDSEEELEIWDEDDEE